MELLTDLKGDFLLTTAWGSARKCSCVSSKLFPFFVMVITGNPICRVHVSITDVISSPVTFKDLPWRKRKTQLRISNIHSRVLYVKDREKKMYKFSETNEYAFRSFIIIWFVLPRQMLSTNPLQLLLYIYCLSNISIKHKNV